MTRKEALAELIAKVEAGEKLFSRLAMAAGFTEFQARRREAGIIYGYLDRDDLLTELRAVLAQETEREGVV
jgi:hypothetical protein